MRRISNYATIHVGGTIGMRQQAPIQDDSKEGNR
jgi:hypothetical protein